VSEEFRINVGKTVRSKPLRRRHETVTLLTRTFYLVLSLVPAVLVAWQWNRVLLFIQQTPPVVQSAPVVQAPAPRQPQRISVPRKPEIEPRARIIDERETERTPLTVEQVVVNRPPQRTIAIDLEHTRQQTTFDVESPESWRVTGIEGQACTVEPATGKLTGPVVVTIDKPRKITLTIRLRTIESGDRSLARLQVVPEVLADNGRTVAFTIYRIERYRTGVIKDGNETVAAIEELTAEKNQKQNWLDSAGNKPLLEWKSAIGRINVISRDLPVLQERAAALNAELELTNALLELAQKLNGSSLQLEKVTTTEQASLNARRTRFARSGLRSTSSSLPSVHAGD
jgi:hypothetical protein